MGQTNVKAIEIAGRLGLAGIQVSMGSVADHLHLRRKEVRKSYLDASRRHRVRIASLALTVLNQVPLMNEPRAGYWLAESIRVASDMNVPIVLLPFFGKGLLREKHTEDMRRVTDVLAQAARDAERAGVALGLETYLSAEAHLSIIESIGSPAIRVYYDIFNANHEGHDYLKEIRLLGRKHICEVHFKEGPALLGQSRVIDWTKVMAELRAIDYDGWIVLETQSPHDLEKDTRRNIAFVRRLLETTPGRPDAAPESSEAAP